MKRDALELLDHTPPHDPHAEAVVLSTLLVNPPLLDSADIRAEHFYRPSHRTIFAHMAGLREDNRPIDMANLVESMRDNGDYERIGFEDIGAALSCSMPSRFAEYMAVLRERAGGRQIVKLLTDTLPAAYSGRKTPELLDDLRAKLRTIDGLVESEGIQYSRITAAQLASAQFSLDYHIPGVLVAGQPQGIFGAKKSLKTSLMLDMAVALASGRPWLGYFHVTKPVRVVVFSGESGMATIQETMRRICEAAGVDLASLPITFSDTLPQFGSLPHMDALEAYLSAEAAEVAFFDPVYLSLLTGGNEGSIFAMGPLLRSVSELCQRLGVTPILLHHMKRGVADPYAPGDLDDASWAGFSEFVRGWMLLNRREKYEPGSGLHKLWLSVGGSAGHSGLWGLDIYEGVYSGPGSRTWDVQVLKPEDVRQEVEEAQSKVKAAKQDAKFEQVKRDILRGMAKLKRAATMSEIRTQAGRNGQAFSLAFADLLSAGDVVSAGEITKGNNRAYDSYQLSGGMA